MLPPNVSSWDSFVFQGMKFLALFEGAKVHIYDSGMHNYGSWMTVTNFKKKAKKVESLSELWL